MADTFRDDAHKIFEYKQPDEILKGFESRQVSLGVTSDGQTSLGLLTFPDLDGKPIFVPRIFNQDKDFLVEPMEKAGATVVKSELTNDERSKLVFCLDTLKLSILLSTQGLNTHIDLKQFEVPLEKTESTKFLIVQGDAGVGKSTFIATMGLRYNIPSISLDTFSGKTPQAYLDFFKQKGLDYRSDDIDVIKAVEEFRVTTKQTAKLTEVAPTQSLSNYLDTVLLDKFKSGKRPPVMLVEGIGSRGVGIMSSNSYHLASGAGEYSFRLDRGKSLEADTMYFKGNIMAWAESEGSYIQKEFLRLVKQ